jgi:hypothetical protein
MLRNLVWRVRDCLEDVEVNAIWLTSDRRIKCKNQLQRVVAAIHQMLKPSLGL